MLTVNKVFHNGTYQKGLYVGFDEDLKQRAKQAIALWGRTLRCWHLGYSAENYRKVKLVFPDTEVIRNPNDTPAALAPGLQNSHNTDIRERQIMKPALEATQLEKQAIPHTMRLSFATHVLEAGTDPRFIQALLGPSSIKPPTRYTHLTQKGTARIISPLARVSDSLGLTNTHSQNPKK